MIIYTVCCTIRGGLLKLPVGSRGLSGVWRDSDGGKQRISGFYMRAVFPRRIKGNFARKLGWELADMAVDIYIEKGE